MSPTFTIFKYLFVRHSSMSITYFGIVARTSPHYYSISYKTETRLRTTHTMEHKNENWGDRLTMTMMKWLLSDLIFLTGKNQFFMMRCFLLSSSHHHHHHHHWTRKKIVMECLLKNSSGATLPVQVWNWSRFMAQYISWRWWRWIGSWLEENSIFRREQQKSSRDIIRKHMSSQEFL